MFCTCPQARDADPPPWETITALLTILSITAALILALVSTFYSAVSFGEIWQRYTILKF